MKKHLLFLFAALLPLVASAEKVEIDGIWYNLVSKAKQAEVTTVITGNYSGSITIPDTVSYEGKEYSVTSIGNGAFFACKSLTDITIPKGVTNIGEMAFDECNNLTTVYISDIAAWCNIKFTNGSTPLFYAHNLYLNGELVTEVTIPEGVTSIGDYAFRGCSSLTTIVLPKSVKYIHIEAFANCSELTDVYCYAETVPGTEADAFNGSYIEYATLHVPESAVESYKSITPWSNFGKIVPLTEEEAVISNASANRIKVQGHRGTLRVTGAAEGDAISVYTIDGMLVTQESAEESETLLTLPTGQVYIVKVADKVVKIGM